MLIKVPKYAKDTTEFHKEPVSSRRNFLKQALAATTLTLMGPQFLLGHKAYGAALNCPPATLVPGGFGQIYMQGGPAPVPMFAPIITDQMNSSIVTNYGLSAATNMVQVGKNWMTDSKSAWGQILMQGPPGVSAATWKTILQNTAIGGNYGDFGQDDGNGADQGMVAGFAGINNKNGGMPKDFKFNTNNTPAYWAHGASLSLSNVSPASLVTANSLVPAATGLTTATDIANASTAAMAIEAAFEAVSPVSAKKGGSTFITNAGCSLNNNPPVTAATFGTNNFTPGNITNITNLVPAANIAAMTPQAQATLVSAYQSAQGFIGGVVVTNGNCDYHAGQNGQTPQVSAAQQDQINATSVISMLAGFAAAKQPGVILINANGSVSCGSGNGATSAAGNTNQTINQNGVTLNVVTPNPQGDNGGTFSQGLMLFYHPTGALPSVKINGSVNSSGKTTGAAGSPANAMAGLMASALYYLNSQNIPNSFLKASGLSASQLTPLMCVS